MPELQEHGGQASCDDSFGFDTEGRPVDLNEDRQPVNSDGVHSQGVFYICVRRFTGLLCLEANVVNDRTELKSTALDALPHSVREAMRAKLGDQLGEMGEISRAAS